MILKQQLSLWKTQENVSGGVELEPVCVEQSSAL